MAISSDNEQDGGGGIPEDALAALTSRSAGEALRDDWMPACLQCLHVNEPTTQICQNCSAPMSHITVFGPWERIYAYGFAFRNMVDGQSRTSVLVGTWIMFGDVLLIPVMLAGWFISQMLRGGVSSTVFIPDFVDPISTYTGVVGILWTWKWSLENVVGPLLGLFIVALHVTVLYKPTRNW